MPPPHYWLCHSCLLYFPGEIGVRETRDRRSAGKEQEGGHEGAVRGGDREEREEQPVPPNPPPGTFFQ